MPYFKAKMHQIRFPLGLRPRRGSLQYSAPQTQYLDLRGLLLREGEGREAKEERVGGGRKG